MVPTCPSKGNSWATTEAAAFCPIFRKLILTLGCSVLPELGDTQLWETFQVWKWNCSSHTREVHFGYLIQLICKSINKMSLYFSFSCGFKCQILNCCDVVTCPLSHSPCLVPAQDLSSGSRNYNCLEAKKKLHFSLFSNSGYSCPCSISSCSPHTSSTALPPSVHGQETNTAPNLFFFGGKETTTWVNNTKMPTKLKPRENGPKCSEHVEIPS